MSTQDPPNTDEPAGRPDPAPTSAPPASPPRPKIARMPLVPVAGAMVLGIVAGRYAALPTAAWWALAVAGAAGAAATIFRGHLRLATAGCVAACVLGLSAARCRLVCHDLAADDLASYVGTVAHLATVRGRVVSAPQTRIDPGAPSYRRGARMTYTLAATEIRLQADAAPVWQPVEGLTQVTMQQPDSRLQAGTEIEAMGWLGPLSPPSNPGQFDWARAALRQGIRTRMTVRSAAAITPRGPGDISWTARWWWRVRSLAREHVSALGETADAQLLTAMVIGERDPALRDLNQAMVEAGVAHFLSISGLHLGIFVGFLYLLCRLLLLDRRRSAWVVLAVLAAYVLIAEPRPALLRSAVMAGSLCLALIAGRAYSATNALAAAAVILLAAWPLHLFAPGFQLSFVCVGGMLLLHRPAKDLLFGRWLRLRGLTVYRDGSAWRRRLRRRLADGLMDAATFSVTAFAVSAPLVAWHFGRFSPYAPLLSLLLLPVVVAVLVPGYLSILLAWPMPNLAYQIGHLAVYPARWLTRLVTWARVLPGLSFELRPVTPAWLIACYAFLVVLAWRKRIPHGRWLAGACALAVAGLTVHSQLPAPPPASAQLDLLAIGGGQCAVLRTPSGKTYLLDAGTISRSGAGESTLVPFLRSQRLPLPAAAWISHANTDHYNALDAVLARGALKRTYLNDYFGTAAPAGSEEAALMDSLRHARVDVVRLRDGEAIQLDDRTRVEVLWPPADKPAGLTVNDHSLVLRITCDGQSLLVPGDLDVKGQAHLTAQPGRLRSDVLILPHHGGWDKTLPDFVAAVAPKTVLVSAGQEPRGPLTNPTARDFYHRVKTERDYYSTPRHGWIRLRFGNGKVDVRTMRRGP